MAMALERQSTDIEWRTAASRSRLDTRLETGFDFAGAEYRALFEASDSGAFQHPLWLTAFYRDLAPHYRAKPVVITGRDVASGELVFVLPLLERRRTAIVMLEAANLGVGDYSQPIVRKGWQAPAGFANDIARVMPKHDILNIRPVRPEALDQWRQFVSAASHALHYSAHAVAVAPPFATWRAKALDPSFGKYLDRKKKRFLKSGSVSLTWLSDPQEIASAIGSIAAMRRGRFADDILQNGFARDFYSRVAASSGESGFGRVYRLTLDGKPVAIAFGLVLRGRFYYLLIGADYQEFGKHSPGLVLYDLMIEDWIAEGGEIFDFTIGDENFKADFGATPVPVHALVNARSMAGKLALAAFRGFRLLRKPPSTSGSSWGTAKDRAD